MNDLDFLDALRFAEAVDALDRGVDTDIDPREDPTLAAEFAVAIAVRAAVDATVAAPRHRSYRVRSRSHVLRKLEERLAPASATPEPIETHERSGWHFFHLRILTPIATAAAAAAVVLGIVALQQAGGGNPTAPEQVAVVEPTVGSTDELVPPSTTASDAPKFLGVTDAGFFSPEEYQPPSLRSELEHINALVAAIAEAALNEQEVDPDLLRAVTETTANIAYRIETAPDTVSIEEVITYMQSTGYGRQLLATVKTDEDAEGALSAARRAAQDGVVVASAYFQQNAP